MSDKSEFVGKRILKLRNTISNNCKIFVIFLVWHSMELTVTLCGILSKKKSLGTLAQGNRPVQQKIRDWVLVGMSCNSVVSVCGRRQALLILRFSKFPVYLRGELLN